MDEVAHLDTIDFHLDLILQQLYHVIQEMFDLEKTSLLHFQLSIFQSQNCDKHSSQYIQLHIESIPQKPCVMASVQFFLLLSQTFQVLIQEMCQCSLHAWQSSSHCFDFGDWSQVNHIQLAFDA